MVRWCLALACVALLLPAALRAEDRSYDGSGNNLLNPTWGMAGTDFIRIAPAAYGDGISTPSGADRPNVRDISNAIVAQSGSIPNTMNLSDMVFQWGQFLDHDMDLTNQATPAENFNIVIPTGDPIFDPGSTGTQIMPLTRSQYDPTTGITTPRQQVNSVSSYIDGSQIYGSDPARAAALRTGTGGQMKTSPGNLLPLNTLGLANGDNGDPAADQYYVAGDVRVNEQEGLTAIQTLFLREHNRQAALLAAANPTWTDEQIYQQARKIVGAEIQSITYQEFLPALLGSAAPGITSTYNPNVNATIANEFATAFFRFGHSMLSPDLLRMQNDGTPAPGGPLSLQDAFFPHQGMSSPNQVDYILKGLTMDTQQEIDVHMVDGVRNFLFGEPTPGSGQDLASLNLQRGRDHGLPDYNTIRVAYGLAPVTSFADITSDVSLQAQLRAVYGTTGGLDNVNDIDPWLGALAEDHLPGMDVGPLIADSLIDQFTRLRDGDRFFFTNDPGLTPDELSYVENLSLCDIIEANTGLTGLQANVFQAVPEPSTLLLAGGGLAALVGWTRRRRRATATGASRAS
ncbi:MAG TPA: peroxidase family protein [Pirellulales bacterium]|jgi:hypothetical protein|nr:peroxidase family protein [Pirellulales bacterium]